MTSFSWLTVALAVLAVPVFPEAAAAEASAPRALLAAVDTTALAPGDVVRKYRLIPSGPARRSAWISAAST